MSRFTTVFALVAAALTFTAGVAAANEAPADDSASASAESTVGFSVGFEVWGRTLLGAGIMAELTLGDTLRVHGGASAGIIGRSYALGLAVTPLGARGLTPILEGGLTFAEMGGGCGGGCGEDHESEIGVMPHGAVGIAWYGENWWVRAEGVAHWGGDDIDDFVILPGFATGYAF